MTEDRQPHAALDMRSRRLKGLKIERLLGLAERRQPLRLLEVGTGSGGIAHYFATHPTLQCHVTAVDVVDQRLIREGYDFHLVHDTALPFADASFDVVLSNHVIEHVGERPAQLAHLRELRRVMAPDGVGYLAVPNRWMLIEPHYRLAFLSWLPRPLRSPYLRLMRRGERYDCEPLTVPRLESLLAEAGFVWRHLEVEALRATLDIEGAHGPGARLAALLPDLLLARARCAIPTLICRIGSQDSGLPGNASVDPNGRPGI
jgi:ubiquinone/menaquinone biosynthesis C-methylase UbiE